MTRDPLPSPSISRALLLLTTVLTACGGASADDMGASGDELTTVNARIVGTGGVGLRVRREPSTTSATVDVIADGTPVRIQCRARGQAVGASDIWDYLPDRNGWVFERYVALEADVPTCGSNAPAPVGPRAEGPAERPRTADSALGDAAVAEARRWLGTRASHNCQPFSSALGRPCEAWCADFMAYVWQTSGADIQMLTAWAGTFFDYGQTHGTLKPRDATDVAPGDAVIWGRDSVNVAHVGLVAEVLANGDLVVVNGNWGSAVQEQTMPRSSVVGGYRIGGFVSPVAR